MKYFKNSIVVICCWIGVVILQSIVMLTQNTPELILNLCDSVFYFETWIALGLLLLAIYKDCINYRRSRR